VTGAPIVLAVAVPVIFLHVRYQPKVHVGLGSTSRVHVEVTTMTPGGRRVTRTTGVAAGAKITVRAG